MCCAMVSGPTEPNKIRLPSDGPCAVYWWAMLPPAPARLSTTRDAPMFSPSFFAMMRAPVSAAPPAAKPTTMVMVFLGGKSFAWAPKVRPAVSRASVACRKCRLVMVVSGIKGMRSIATQTELVGLTFLHGMAQQRGAAVNAVGEFVVRQGGEQRHHAAQVHGQGHR